MDVTDKLRVLTAAAKYDVSCASSGSDRGSVKGGIGSVASGGICHSFTPDGRCISLLKILMTNACIYDCAYCGNRRSNDIERATFTVDEIISLTMNFYRRNYIEGLFLSSAVVKSPNHTMEMITRVVEKLRVEMGFNGYIHIKGIPGADEQYIKRAGLYADRMSVNLELPSSESLMLLAPEKKKEDIFAPMDIIKSNIIKSKSERKQFKHAPIFVPAGQSTQMIVGATAESDYKILNLSENLYNRYSLKRVYYSAYIPVNTGRNLPELLSPPTLREHRLYQGDWLLRLYGFKANELLSEKNPNFDINFDPKTTWAMNNIDSFPVEVNKASYEMLVRIPGIGLKGAQKIVSARRIGSLTFEDIKKLGVVIKRAQYFITCRGKYFGAVPVEADKIKIALMPKLDLNIAENNWEQLNFFSGYPNTAALLAGTIENKRLLLSDANTSLTGEI